MTERRAEIARIIAAEFGKPGDRRARSYFRLIRRALFAASPAAFPACIRLAELARAHGWRRAAAWMRQHMERRFGCYVHPDAQIGKGLQTPHPVAIVIGSGCRIGVGVIVYQNVTLGTSEQASYLAGARSYPTIGDGTILYTGAVVIGAIDVGPNVVVGANAVVTRDVPPDCIAVGVPAVVKTPRTARATPPTATHPEPSAFAGQTCPR